LAQVVHKLLGPVAGNQGNSMITIRSIICAAALCIASSTAFSAQMSDAQVKKAVIAESIASTPGNCPCPYNTDRRGHSCGRRSSYSRAGGYGPMCFPADVKAADISQYRLGHGQ
jgi:hypothetical protein